jgi:hypothetical protein
MQTLANTQTIRNIVNNIVGDSAKYTDKGVNNTRLLTWDINYADKHVLVKEIQDLFTLVGFTNRIKVTTSNYTGCMGFRSGGRTYLRINASYNK